MAHMRHYRVWESEFDNTVSTKDKMQDIHLNELKLEVRDNYNKNENTTKTFEPSNIVDVINKVYLVEKSLKIDGHLSILEKDYNEFKLRYNKQSVEVILIQRAVKATIQILYDKVFLDSFLNAYMVLRDLLFVTRRRIDLKEINNVIQ